MENAICIKGARVNNLKNVDLVIPRDRLIVVTGLSGSGKSSLAFDLGRMHKPECDYIKGLPPAIAIEQKVTSRNPRSTVGTSTEIYDYLRLLFARVGHTFSPVSGQEVKRNVPQDVVDCAQTYSPGTRFTVIAPLRLRGGRTLQQQLEAYLQQGLSRLDADGEFVRIEDYLAEHPEAAGATEVPPRLWLLIDRLAVGEGQEWVSRVTDSVETAFFEGDGECLLRVYPARVLHHFSIRFEADGMKFTEPDDNMFSFNSPLGACPKCEGFGRVMGIDESLVVPNSALSVYDGAVVCWRGEKMGMWKDEFCRQAVQLGFPVFEPYYNLTREQKDVLWHGTKGNADLCIDAFFRMLEENQYKIQYRVMLARYRGKTVCPVCRGSRLKPEADYVKVGGRSISELVRLPVKELQTFFDELNLTEHDAQVAQRLLTEIRSRLYCTCHFRKCAISPSASMCGKEHHGQNREEKRRRLPRKIPMTRRRSPPDTVQQFSLSLSPRVNPHRKTAHFPYPTTESSQPTECASTPQTARSRLHGLHRKSLRQNPGRTQNPDPRHRNSLSNNSIRPDSASFWRLQCVQHRPTNGTASVKIQSPFLFVVPP